MDRDKIRDRIKDLHKSVEGDFDKLAAALNEEFGWTVDESYMATEFLYRPENYN